MEKEYLIKKWLDNDLSPEEFEAFKSLKEHPSLTKLADATKKFRAPEIVYEKALDEVEQRITSRQKSAIEWYKPVLKIAAVLAICLGCFQYIISLDSSYATDLAEKTQIALPDTSTADLNAVSQISFNKNTWDDQREVHLEGEAFFKVAKGSTFNVITDIGMVTVLGTQFNIKQRKNYFEVRCYEGSVAVAYQSTSIKLAPGQSFLVINDKVITADNTLFAEPTWLDNSSAFKSIPLKEVLSEFERQYAITIISKNIDQDQLFTGKFTHNNLEVALATILEPFKVSYTTQKNTIILSRE